MASNTKQDLLLAAERLVAMQGVAATTISQINEAAEQRNRSAIYYHFGSLDAVLQAIFELRAAPAEAHRARLLAEARDRPDGLPPTLDSVARALVLPIASRVLDNPGPHYFSRFSLAIRMESDFWQRMGLSRTLRSLEDARTALSEASPLLPPRLVRARHRFAFDMTMMAIAEIEVAMDRHGPAFDEIEARLRVSELITAVSALYAAPVAPETLALLRRTGDLS